MHTHTTKQTVEKLGIYKMNITMSFNYVLYKAEL